MSRDQIHTIVQSAIIAALYFLLTWAFAPISFSGVQVRISEALYAFCLFTPCGIWGMSAGCLLANLFFSPYGFLDILLGTLATFMGAIGVYALRKNKMVAFACPVISNAFLVPVVLQVAAGLPYVANLLYVAVGEGIAVYAIGLLAAKLCPAPPVPGPAVDSIGADTTNFRKNPLFSGFFLLSPELLCYYNQ